MPPERPLASLLDGVARRLRLGSAAWALGAGGVGAAVTGLLPIWPTSATRGLAMLLAGAAVAVVVMGVRRPPSSRAAAAAAIERHDAGLRNIVITAAELLAHPERASGWMRDRVARDAAAASARLSPAAVVPLQRPMIFLASGITAAVVVLLLDPSGLVQRAAGGGPSGSGAASLAEEGPSRVTVLLEPPAYTGLPPREEVDPERIAAVEGTRLRLRISGTRAVRVRFGAAELDVTAAGGGSVAELVLRDGGYLAVEPIADEGERRLIPVQVTPDRAPAIRIEAPARDLLLPPAAANVPITALAQDDFGLAMLEIRYTRVSGSGEQFEFEEGTLPTRLTRASEREWRAEAELPVSRLNLGPGDSVVYRAVGRDARPGEAGLASSDTYFVEIQGRGQVVIEGLEMPPDEERYALSQQMVVQKIERLRARERGMSAEAVREEAALIAAEQRSVRANFIFLMGGHVEDEEEEAEHSHEIQEGRLENSARKEISIAIHHMTGAEQGLIAISTAQALPPARAAVEALQRAFGRNRYLLRSLAVQSRIDPARRLTGRLDAASGWRRPVDEAEESPHVREVRGLLAGLLRAASALADDAPVEPARLAALAEQALAIDPASAVWQQVAGEILEARGLAAASAPRRAILERLQRATAPVSEAARAAARAPAPPGTRPSSALERAWADEVRR